MTTTDLARAIVDLLDDDALADLAYRLSPFLEPRGEPAEDRWLTTREAADYLGISLGALHRLTAERRVPFEQEAPGCKCWFKRSELDAWRAGELQTRPTQRVA